MEHESLNKTALSATLHCLSGCAIGEIAGMVIGTALGLSNLVTVALAVFLAFIFGYSLSLLPVVKSGLALAAAMPIVLASDTLSIATMEIVDNFVMLVIPGAMDSGLVNPLFWMALPVSLLVAGMVAYPLNRYLLTRGKGHALVHAAMGHGTHGSMNHGHHSSIDQPAHTSKRGKH